MSRVQRLSLLAACWIFLNATANAGYPGPAPARQWHWLERDWGTALVLRPYRSYGSFFVGLEKDEDFIVWEQDEFKLYRDLARRSFRPGYFLIELTGYPLAAFSAWFETEANDSYHGFDIGEKFNLIRSLGAGYQEPWSASIFLGQIANFWDFNDQDELIVAASGVAGLVVTGGYQQLFSNSVLEAGWFRVEWKIKGEGTQGARSRFWDLKVGYRYYGIPAIANTMTLSLARERTDRSSKGAGLLANSITALELQLPTSEVCDGFSRVLFEYARFVPLRKVLAGLKVGFLYENRKPYLTETGFFGAEKDKSWELIVQPVIIF
ncbi:hypothetical protein ACFL4K_01640 [Candidatus Neomarinimicrobiota bacterium]